MVGAQPVALMSERVTNPKLMRPAALKIHGTFRGTTGYDRHVRAFVRALHRQGAAIQLVDLPQWSPLKLPPAQRDPWFETLDRPVPARTTLHFVMPHQVVPAADRLNVNYTMFEADRIPPLWAQLAGQHDLVIVPTESSRQAWLGSGVSERRLRLCPLGVDSEAFSGDTEALPLRLESGEAINAFHVRFLNVSSAIPRKNLPGLLRAWLRATARSDDAVLVLKLSMDGPDSPTKFREQLDSLQHDVGKTLREAAPVHIMSDLLSDADMPRLYAAATHYISLSHGEGWDQPMVEAGAMGLRLIAPDHSAYVSYLDASVATLISSPPVAVAWPRNDPTALLFDGAQWWEPNEDAAVNAIRAAIHGTDMTAASAAGRIRRDLTWDRAAERLMALLGELEASKARRWFRPRRRAYTPD
jgi:glycosyltransferase involved in cell wall biosynthesis